MLTKELQKESTIWWTNVNYHLLWLAKYEQLNEKLACQEMEFRKNKVKGLEISKQ
jgi:hypothetical protein